MYVECRYERDAGDLRSNAVLGQETGTNRMVETGKNYLVIASEAWRSAFSKLLRLTQASTLPDILVSS